MSKEEKEDKPNYTLPIIIGSIFFILLLIILYFMYKKDGFSISNKKSYTSVRPAWN